MDTQVQIVLNYLMGFRRCVCHVAHYLIVLIGLSSTLAIHLLEVLAKELLFGRWMH